jgi:hypothetical protein
MGRDEVPEEEGDEQTKQYITLIENTHIMQMYIFNGKLLHEGV